MVQELKIENLGIINFARLQFSPGFNAITGESGSGKSLLVNSLLFLLGHKPGNVSAGNFSDSATVEGLFDLDKTAFKKIKELGYEIKGDELIIQRAINPDGKVRSFLNGKMFPSTAIRSIGEVIAETHVQNKTHKFLDESNHLKILDSYIGQEHIEELDKFSHGFAELCRLESEINKVRSKVETLKREKDFLQFQYDEISAANLKAGEEEENLQIRNQLANSEKINQLLDETNTALGKTEREGAIDLICVALDKLEKLSEINPQFKKVGELINQSAIYLEEAYSELNKFNTDNGDAAERLEEVEQRLDLINRLKRKYNAMAVAEVLQKMHEIKQQIDFLERSDIDLAELDNKAIAKRNEVYEAARKLHAKRAEASKSFQEAVTAELKLLNMPFATFEVLIKENSNCSHSGMTNAAFLIKTNKGLDLMPLGKVASGGELSRIILAIKSLLGANYSASSLIFDEIDSGIGGETALHIGRRLKKLSASQQVICVTHSAQVAAFADRHYGLAKETDSLATSMRAEELKGDERLIELARMMSGQITEVSFKHAKELLENRAEALKS